MRPELPRFRRRLDASGRKPQKVRFRCRERGCPILRREAIRLALLGRQTQGQLAEDLGISDVTLRNWLKQGAVSAPAA